MRPWKAFILMFMLALAGLSGLLLGHVVSPAPLAPAKLSRLHGLLAPPAQ